MLLWRVSKVRGDYAIDSSYNPVGVEGPQKEDIILCRPVTVT